MQQSQLIREALHPYPDGLAIVSKVGARRDAAGAVLPYDQPDELRRGIEDNLRTLGVEWQCTGGDIMADGTIRHRQPRPA